MLISVALILSPYGRDLIHSAYYSGEQLARSLGQLLVYISGGIMAAAIAAEWLLRWWLATRRGA